MAKILMVGGVALAMMAVPSMAAEQIVNGDFAAGLAGWTQFQQPQGTVNIQATSFDITGGGVQSAVRMHDVGKTGGAVPQGGGLFQMVTLGSLSNVSFSADYVATIVGFAQNASGGIFALTIDDVAVASYDAGFIFFQEVRRGSLAYTGQLGPGTYKVGLLSTRDFGSSSDLSQYYSNVSFDAVPQGGVPEPATWLMLIAGFGLVGSVARRRAAVQQAG